MDVHVGPVWRCQWCTAVYADEHRAMTCPCPSRKFLCDHGIEWDHKSSADYCGCDDDNLAA